MIELNMFYWCEWDSRYRDLIAKGILLDRSGIVLTRKLRLHDFIQKNILSQTQLLLCSNIAKAHQIIFKLLLMLKITLLLNTCSSAGNFSSYFLLTKYLKAKPFLHIWVTYTSSFHFGWPWMTFNGPRSRSPPWWFSYFNANYLSSV